MLADRAVLEARVRAPTTEQRDVFRARIILLADDGDLGRPRRTRAAPRHSSAARHNPIRAQDHEQHRVHEHEHASRDRQGGPIGHRGKRLG